MQGADLGGLISLMGDAMGPCDTVIDTVQTPWAPDDAGQCEDLEQTESNVLAQSCETAEWDAPTQLGEST